MMMWKFVLTILIVCVATSQATFGDFFKSDKGPSLKHGGPSYSVPIFKYGPPQMKYGPPSNGNHGPPPNGNYGPPPNVNHGPPPSSGGHQFPNPQQLLASKKQFLTKSISKVSHGGGSNFGGKFPSFPLKSFGGGGPKPVYGPPQQRRPQFAPQQHHGPSFGAKGHCDGWIPILGPQGHQEVQAHVHHVPEQLHVVETLPVPEQQVHIPEQIHLPEATLPVQNIVPHETYGVPGGHVEENSLHVVQSNVGVEAVPAVEEHHHHVVENTLGGGDLGPAPVIPNVLSNELSGGFDIIKSHGIELTNFGGNGFKQLPPPLHAPTATYGLPNPGPPINFRPPPSYHHKLQHPVFHGAPKNVLGIRYGSVSGNLKPWPIPGTPPKYPLSFREPVPQGLIESIGHNVQHLDNYGVKLHPQNNIYLPPPPSPLPISNLHSLPLKQHQGFLTQGYFEPQQQVAHESNQVAITHHHTCQHGPNLAVADHGFNHVQVGGYEAAASNNLLTVEEKSVAPADISAHGQDISSYGPPASGSASTTTHEIKHEQLPGLDGLNVISAQKSHTVEVPTHNVGGTAYDVQFQQSIASTGHGSPVQHDQLVNNGLLQSIISAVEQPPQTHLTAPAAVHEPSVDQRADTSDDVKIVFNSTQSIEALKPKADN